MTVTSHFVKQSSFAVDYAPAKITNWRSQRTGLQLTYIDQASPIVNGYFAVATEIPDDSGCPHTLEHLIFMGSSKYRYKGLLDTLGNRLYSATNAWTGVDQTVYTLTTAGWDGFKVLLPVYLDHLFNPTLTEEAFLTEVYHIDGKGREKGVVFSEMQALESQSWFITYTEMHRELYAKDSGYSSETGGLMSELRHLNNDKVKDFHKAMYRPENLCVIITGSVDERELLDVMSKIDDELEDLPEVARKRPFVDSKPDLPLTKTVIKEVEFPEKDETMGEVIIAWIGPKGEDIVINAAIDMIGAYFTDSPISLLNKHMVEIENPLANEISFLTDPYLRTGIDLTLSSVPTESLREADAKVKELIKLQTDPSSFDLTYIQQLIRQQKLQIISETEKAPRRFADTAICEYIYGNIDGSGLKGWLQDLSEYDELLTWDSEKWCNVIEEYFVKNKSVTILGKPSAEFDKLVKQKNKEFYKDTKKRLGKEGLKKLQDKIDNAQLANNVPIPEELITQFVKPNPAKIQFIETKSFKAGANTIDNETYITDGPFNEILKKDTPKDFPLSLHFEAYDSQFTTVNILLTSTAVDTDLLRYMSIIEELFALSIQIPGGEYIPFDSVISQINDDLVEFQIDNGFDGQFFELVNVKIKFENENYEKAIDWLVNVLKNTVFEESRIKVIIEKIINAIPEKKRDGEYMMSSSQYRNIYQETSLRKAQDSIYTEEFYKGLLDKINKGEFKTVESDLIKLRRQLFNIDNLKLVIIGGVEKLAGPVSSWNKFVSNFHDIRGDGLGLDFVTNLPRAFQFKSDTGSQCSCKSFVTTLPAIESSYLHAVTPMPTSYFNDDIYKIALAAEFLSALEGPLYKAVRGNGLAYDALVRHSVETGLLGYNIYRGSDTKQAWIAAKKTIEDLVSGTVKIEQLELDNSVAGIVNGIARAESNAYDAARGKFNDDILKKRGPNFIGTYLDKLNKITTDDVVYILKKYFLPIFDSKKSLLFAAIPSDYAEEFETFLKEQGYEVNIEEVGKGAHEEEERCEHSESEGSDSDSGSESE